MKQKVVYVASRVRGNLQLNLADAKKYCRYCVLQGAVPIVPHLMYVGALNDEDPTERKLGMDLGITILQAGFIDELWAFTDSEGPSEGMKKEIEIAGRLNIQVHYFRKDSI